jgi:hypothetical protein
MTPELYEIQLELADSLAAQAIDCDYHMNGAGDFYTECEDAIRDLVADLIAANAELEQLKQTEKAA